jgi:adenine-specific DNA-methyltransferase
MGVAAQRIVAVDLDKKPSSADGLATTYRGREFLSWSLSTDRMFSKIVANPPFVSFRRLSKSLNSVAAQLNCDWVGSASGNSNLWFAFLRASLSLLKHGGSLGFIVPAAFEYADYAARLRQEIHGHFAEFQIHRSRRPLFEDVQDGCVVLIGRRYESENRKSVRFEYQSSQELIEHLSQPRKGKSVSVPGRIGNQRQDAVMLSDVFAIRIGCVTGDSRFFLLRESDRVRHGLPSQCLQRVLTRSRHLKTGFASRAIWQQLKDADERVWLFRPADRHLALPAVKRYLALAAENGGCARNNYKVSLREVWHRVDLPDQVHAFVSGTSQHGPWICLNNDKNLSATNTLYCLTFKKSVSSSRAAAWALCLFTREFRKQFLRRLQTYPDGLTKIEPGDLAGLTIRRPPQNSKKARATYRRAVKVLISKGRVAAERLAEDWLDAQQKRGPTRNSSTSQAARD